MVECFAHELVQERRESLIQIDGVVGNSGHSMDQEALGMIAVGAGVEVVVRRAPP